MIFLFFWGGDTKSQFFNFEGGGELSKRMLVKQQKN